MKQTVYYYLILTSLLFALFFYALNNNIIIFRSPFTQNLESTLFQNRLITKKTIPLWYWHNERWNKEETEIIWDQDEAKTVQHILNAWLTMLDEEAITPQKISLQSVAITVSGNEAVLSFDQSLFNQESPILQKLYIIESLLKTLRATSIKLKSIYILAQHKTVDDAHLDFSKPWPLSGYLEK